MLNERSRQVRRDTIVLSEANGGYHYGGSFSAVEILIALYDYVLEPEDKFILSKGHACWPYYVLLREGGLDPKLEGHPHRDPENGIYCTTGSLGHGFPIGVGIAMAKKLNNDDGKVYVLMGDGECQEGTTWESLLIASRYKLNNLCVIVDYNKIQGSGRLLNVLNMNSSSVSVPACVMCWNCVDVCGHDVDALAENLKKGTNDPKLIIAHTTKGKGVSFMEDNPEWHSKWLSPEQKNQALKELS